MKGECVINWVFVYVKPTDILSYYNLQWPTQIHKEKKYIRNMCDINTTYGWDKKTEAKSFLDNLHKFGVVAFIQLHSPTDIRVYQCANVSIEYTIRFNQFIRPKLKSSRLVYSGFWIFNDISIQWWIVSDALNFPWVSQKFRNQRKNFQYLFGWFLFIFFILTLGWFISLI